MWNKLRTAVAPSIVVVLAAYGMAYAATGSTNPIDLMSNHSKGDSSAHVTPEPTSTPDVGDDPAESAEPTDAPDTSDAPEPSHTPKASHGHERSTVGCPDGFTGNHGQFVSKSDDHHAAARSECGKPVHSERPEVSSSPNDEGAPESSESPDPDSAGDHHGNGNQGHDGTDD